MKPKQKVVHRVSNVFILSNNSSKQSGPRISLIYFHKISAMHSDLGKSRPSKHHFQSKTWSRTFFSPPEQDQPSEINLPGNLQELSQDIQDIQSFPPQVYNYDDISILTLGYIGYSSTRYIQFAGTWNTKTPSKHHLQSKTWSRPFFFTAPAISTFITETPRKPTIIAAIFTRYPTFPITSVDFLWDFIWS